MGKSRNSVKNIGNFVFVICLIVLWQLGCDWKKFSNRGTQTNTNTETKKENSESPKTEIVGNCVNAYYPVGPTVERKYHITYAKNSFPAQDYTERYGEIKDDGFIVKTEFEKVNTTINWRCTTDGLLATQYNNSVDMKNGSSSTIETVKSEGVTFPVESRWKQSEKWTAKYEISESVKNPQGGEVGEGSGTISQDSEIVGNEEITTTAGTFQTIKLKIRTIFNLTIKVKGISVPTKVSLDTISWFAKDVGMVKTRTEINGMETASTELLSYKK